MIHILLCNLLTTILRPNFEEPLDTAKQLVEKNITLYDIPGTEIWKQFLLESSITEYNILGENLTIIADDWDHFNYMSEHDAIGAGTHAYMAASISPRDLSYGENKEINSGRGWYRSKEEVAGKYPYGGYLTNKKWHLNEEMARHLLYFQQAGLTSLEIKFHEWKWEEEEEVFTLEHIGLALIINAVGLVLSLIVFVIEIIIHKTSLRHAGGVTQDRLEVDHYYQSGARKESSLSVVKTVRDKSKKNDIMEEENITRE